MVLRSLQVTCSFLYMGTTTNRGTSPRKETTMVTTLPETMDEIAAVALAAFTTLPDSVTAIDVVTVHGSVPMTRNSAKAWAK